MSLWDEKFVGWPDFSELPQHKKDIEAGVAAEFKDPAAEVLPASEPVPEAVQVFGDVATTFYFWRGSESASTYDNCDDLTGNTFALEAVPNKEYA